MSASLKTSFAAVVLSFALAGAAAPAFAGGYHPGIDRHNPPGTQNRGQAFLPRLTSPSNVDVTPSGSIGQRVYPPAISKEGYKGGDYRGTIPPTR